MDAPVRAVWTQCHDVLSRHFLRCEAAAPVVSWAWEGGMRAAWAIVLVSLGLSACDRSGDSRPASAAPTVLAAVNPSAICVAPATRAGVLRHLETLWAGIWPRVELSLDQPLLDSYDAAGSRADCSAIFRFRPAHQGGGGLPTERLKFRVQPLADGSGTSYQVLATQDELTGVLTVAMMAAPAPAPPSGAPPPGEPPPN